MSVHAAPLSAPQRPAQDARRQQTTRSAFGSTANRASTSSEMWSPSTWTGTGRPSTERTTHLLDAAERRRRGGGARSRARLESARNATVGTSTGLARVSTAPEKSPESSAAPPGDLDRAALEVRVGLAVLHERADAAQRLAADLDVEPRRAHDVAREERPHRRLGEVPRAEARLQPRVAVDALDHARVEAHAGGEREAPVVEPAEVDAAARASRRRGRAGARWRRRRRWGCRACGSRRWSRRRAGRSAGWGSRRARWRPR